jgi:outer membrane protein TolC
MITETFPSLLAKASEGSRIAEAAYREGGLDLLRLLDAERARIDTEASYYRALLDYHLAAVELKAALGVLR